MTHHSRPFPKNYQRTLTYHTEPFLRDNHNFPHQGEIKQTRAIRRPEQTGIRHSCQPHTVFAIRLTSPRRLPRFRFVLSRRLRAGVVGELRANLPEGIPCPHLPRTRPRRRNPRPEPRLEEMGFALQPFRCGIPAILAQSLPYPQVPETEPPIPRTRGPAEGRGPYAATQLLPIAQSAAEGGWSWGEINIAANTLRRALHLATKMLL